MLPRITALLIVSKCIEHFLCARHPACARLQIKVIAPGIHTSWRCIKQDDECQGLSMVPTPRRWSVNDNVVIIDDNFLGMDWTLSWFISPCALCSSVS